MVIAYILLLVKPGEENTVAEKMNKLDEVNEISVVYGEYDIVAKVENKSMEELQNFLIKKIRAMEEVERTSTLIAIN